MIKNLLAVVVFVLLVLSCQEDTVTENTVALTASSPLTGMLKSMTANDTSIDNVLDGTSCFKIQLPVEVNVNGHAMLVSTAADYQKVNEILDESDEDEDKIIFGYPITLERHDYSSFSVADENQLKTVIAECSSIADYMGTDCVSIVYPITAYTYNSGFQMQNSYSVENNAGLYTILQNMAENEYYAIKYPVLLTVKDGPGITITNNDQFFSAVTNAIEGCKNGGCTNPGVLVDDLLLYMPFSGVVKDLKGNIELPSGSIAFKSDREGNQTCSVQFTGSEFVTVPSTVKNKIDINDAFSVSLWFRMNNTNSNNLETLFAKGVDGAGFEISVFSLNAPQFKAGEVLLVDGDWKADAALPVDITQWHHLVVTVSSGNEISLYRDGQLRATSLIPNGIGTEAMDYYIGKNFQGFLDDLRVYKRVLMPQEIQTLYELDGDCNTCLE
ncbi:hypothetical protein AMR72_14290 [Flavobacterium psychrophilum]|nr:hypothetical protein AMR72_14290 [Flavobacterium psychrophilum]AOE53584.1 hypothetical protein ALW18_14280 [Flavobacterium psychrophilum]